MIELFIFSIVIILFMILRLEHSIIIFVALLPFHAFIKNILALLYDGGYLFSYWKELVIMIMLIKMGLNVKKYYLDVNLLRLISVYTFLIVIYYLVSDNMVVALSALRNHLFTLLLLILYSNISISLKTIKNLYMAMSISFFISYMAGYLQLFFFKIPLGYLMGRIASIDSGGYITYSTTSARILGYERMSGIIGGPNDFGLFVAISLLIVLAIWISELKRIYSKPFQVFLIILLVFGSIALLLSFSRAGWTMFTAGFLLLAYVNNVKFSPIIIAIILPIAISIMPLFIETSFISEIYQSTVSGQELSAADRVSNFLNGLSTILNEPFGHGLGTTDNRYDSMQYFAESAFINLIYEIGFIGFFALSGIFMLLARKSYKMKNENMFSGLSMTIILLTYLISMLSVNTYGMPYIYISWIIIGIGINKNISKTSAILKIRRRLLEAPDELNSMVNKQSEPVYETSK